VGDGVGGCAGITRIGGRGESVTGSHGRRSARTSDRGGRGRPMRMVSVVTLWWSTAVSSPCLRLSAAHGILGRQQDRNPARRHFSGGWLARCSLTHAQVTQVPQSLTDALAGQYRLDRLLGEGGM